MAVVERQWQKFKNNYSGEYVASSTNFTWIIIIKFLTINLPSQHFLCPHLRFHTFLKMFLL